MSTNSVTRAAGNPQNHCRSASCLNNYRCDAVALTRPIAESVFNRGSRGYPMIGRMAESAALLVDEVSPEQPVRQWVLSFPFPLRFLPRAHDPRALYRLPPHRRAPDQEGGVLVSLSELSPPK